MKSARWLLVAATFLAAAGAEAGEAFDYRDTSWTGAARIRLVTPGGRQVLEEGLSNVVFSRDRTWQYDGAAGAWDDMKSFVFADFDAESRDWLADRAEATLAARGADPGPLTMLLGPNVVGRVSSDGLGLVLKMRLRYRVGSGREVVREYIRLSLALVTLPG